MTSRHIKILFSTGSVSSGGQSVHHGQVRLSECWEQRGQCEIGPVSQGLGEAVALEIRIYPVTGLSIPQCFCHSSREKPLQELGLCEMFLRVFTVLVWVSRWGRKRSLGSAVWHYDDSGTSTARIGLWVGISQHTPFLLWEGGKAKTCCSAKNSFAFSRLNGVNFSAWWVLLLQKAFYCWFFSSQLALLKEFASSKVFQTVRCHPTQVTKCRIDW